MDRRADRVIAVAAIAAMALVPTVLVAAVRSGEATPRPAGALPAAQVAGDYKPERLKTPSPAPAPTASLPAGVPPTPPPGGGAAPPKPVVLLSYTRSSDGTFLRKPFGDSQRVVETSRVRTSPKFTVNMTGTHERKVLLLTHKTRIAMTVKGNLMSTFDGISWTRTRLDKQGLALTKAGYEPRVLTFSVASLKGAKRKGPDGDGMTTFTGTTTFGKVLGFIPRSMLGDVYQVIPAKTPTKLTVRADKNGFPRLFTMSAIAKSGELTVRSTFRDYKLDK